MLETGRDLEQTYTKKELCFKLVIYKNYAEMLHGQQNIKNYAEMLHGQQNIKNYAEMLHGQQNIKFDRVCREWNPNSSVIQPAAS